MKIRLQIVFAVLLFLLLISCQNATEQKTETPLPSPISSKTISPKFEAVKTIDVPKLSNKSADELDEILGNPREVKPIENGGEYRLYEIADQPKGLAVRFYGGKAKSFNLILENPVPTSKETLKNFFNIDVGTIAARKDAKEPLSDIYQGIFGGVKFSKVSAKRLESGKGFVFVLAEVAN